MPKRLLTLLSAAFFFFAAIPASAQDGRWDSALDQYEQICEQCIELRQRALAGENVPASSLSSMLSRLATLRESLQAAKGTMSPTQKSRFNRIRDRYAEIMSGRRNLMESGAPAKVFSTAIKDIPAPVTSFKRPSSIEPFHMKLSDIQGGIILFGGFPDGCPGAMGFIGGQRLGGYLKVSSTFRQVRPGFDCLSDGTAGESFIWATGREALCRQTASAGLVYTAGTHVRIYGGAGYGNRSVLWEDMSGKWAKVTDLSSKGFGADAGFILSFGHFAVMAGGWFPVPGYMQVEGSRPGALHIQAEAGVGYIF